MSGELMYPLAPNGVFWTIQGEGALTGEPMVFVRLAGCSVGCAECDTDYRVDRRIALAALVTEARRVVPAAVLWPWVWITGGEPTDHDLAPLVAAFQAAKFRVAICTSGVKAVPHGVEWISVSPHTESIAQRHGHELKLVSGLNGAELQRMADLTWGWGFPYRYVQPLAGDAGSLATCVAFVLTHPGWRLGVQAHKVWGVA